MIAPPSDIRGMASITTLEHQVPVVTLRVFIAGLVFVVVFAIIVADERQPHVEIAPLVNPLSWQPPAVASGAIWPG